MIMAYLISKSAVQYMKYFIYHFIILIQLVSIVPSYRLDNILSELLQSATDHSYVNSAIEVFY